MQTQFSSLMADNAKNEKILTKIYKKKVVRSKKHAEGGSDSDSDEDSDEDVTDSDLDESGEEDEIDETVCPPGCDRAVYERVRRWGLIFFLSCFLHSYR